MLPQKCLTSIRCSALESRLVISPTGKILPCCTFQGDLGQLNEPLRELSFTSIYEKKKNLNTALNKGLFPKECKNCERHESQNHISYRQKINQRFSSDTDSFKIKSLEISFSNKCNLACTMCNNQYSELWNEQHKDIIDKVASPSYLGNHHRELYKSFKPFSLSHESIQMLVEQCADLKELEILGGEPFLDENFFYFLEKLKEQKKYPEGITIVSNGTIYSTKHIEALQSLKHESVALNLSMDATDLVYHYIRGSSFANFEKNFFKFLKANIFSTIVISPTISVYNIFNLPKIVKWFKDQAPNGAILQLNQMLYADEITSLAVLPSGLRNEIIETVVDLQINFPDINFQDILNYLQSLSTASYAQRKDCAVLTDYFNNKRKINIYEIESKLGFLKTLL